MWPILLSNAPITSVVLKKIHGERKIAPHSNICGLVYRLHHAPVHLFESWNSKLVDLISGENTIEKGDIWEYTEVHVRAHGYKWKPMRDKLSRTINDSLERIVIVSIAANINALEGIRIEIDMCCLVLQHVTEAWFARPFHVHVGLLAASVPCTHDRVWHRIGSMVPNFVRF